MKTEEKNALIEHRLARGIVAIDDVEFLIQNKKLHLAVNRIYYGIFYVLSALSLKHDFLTSKHQQLIGWFNRGFVATGKVDAKYGKIIHNAYKNRSIGDYDDFAVFDVEEVRDLFEEMKDFISMVQSLLANEPP